MIEPIPTLDGSFTAKHEQLGQIYHFVNGAQTESKHVYIDNGFLYFANVTGKKEITVFDMGFGTGLNGLMTQKFIPNGVTVRYITVEKYPLNAQECAKICNVDSSIFQAPWNEKTTISSSFSILKIKGDVLETDFLKLSPIDVVYWDPFSPDFDMSLWTEQLFSKIFQSLSPKGVLTTYSSKGIVKRALLGAGFKIERLEGAPGKRHMIRATREQ